MKSSFESGSRLRSSVFQALKRTICECQRHLHELVALKESIRRREVQVPDLDDIPDESTNQAFDYILG
jgi:hypothetical protein